MTALAILALAVSHTVIAIYILRRIDLLADQVIHTLGIQKIEPVSEAPTYNEPSIEPVKEEAEILTDEDEYQIERMRELSKNKSRVSIDQAREGLRSRGL